MVQSGLMSTFHLENKNAIAFLHFYFSLVYLLPVDTVYISGHSLGGIMLETYIQDHPEKVISKRWFN